MTMMGGNPMAAKQQELKRIPRPTQKRIEAIFIHGADFIDEWPEYWIAGGYDQSESFCIQCAEKKLAELLAKEPGGEYCLDGGWCVEGDSQAFCETCRRYLGNCFTQYACDEELNYYDEMGCNPLSADDCYSMENILGSMGWEFPTCKDQSSYDALHRVCQAMIERHWWISATEYGRYLHMWQ